MSLIRQMRALLLAVVLTMLVGGIAVSVLLARDLLQAQRQLNNDENAQTLARTLARALARPPGDAGAALLQAQWDTGAYRRLRFERDDGAVVFAEQATAPGSQEAPAWFVAALPLDAEPGQAPVADGARTFGTLEVVGRPERAHDELWRGALRAAAAMSLLALAALALSWLATRRIRRPLRTLVEQSQALAQGGYAKVDEPRVPELQRLAGAMNRVVARMRALFEAQATQLEALRRQAHCDPLTGLAHRAHFMDRFTALLQREDGAEHGGLVLVRLADPAALNRDLGHDVTDRALRGIAQALQTYPDRAPDCVVGRLNGSDFALALPAAGMAEETATSIANALRPGLSALGPRVHIHLGAVEVAAQASARQLGALMALADLALARAESEGPFAVEVANDAPPAAGGERSWRAQIEHALQRRRARLVEYPVVDRHGALIHLECPLRLQLDVDGVEEPASRWLPLVGRARLAAAVDRHAAELALAAIALDGRPRAVNLAAASLADGSFSTHLRALLEDTPSLARKLWLEVGESAVVERFDVVHEFGRLMRPLGVRLGIEHAGERLGRIERLFELGVDYVKLDAATCAGVAEHEATREFVRSSVTLLHALAVQVIAEGVDSDADARALWACGVDAVTGPWAVDAHAG